MRVIAELIGAAVMIGLFGLGVLIFVGEVHVILKKVEKKNEPDNKTPKSD